MRNAKMAQNSQLEGSWIQQSFINIEWKPTKWKTELNMAELSDFWFLHTQTTEQLNTRPLCKAANA